MFARLGPWGPCPSCSGLDDIADLGLDVKELREGPESPPDRRHHSAFATQESGILIRYHLDVANLKVVDISVMLRVWDIIGADPNAIGTSGHHVVGQSHFQGF